MNKPNRFDELARYARVDPHTWDTDAAWSRLHARVQMRSPKRRVWLVAALLVLALSVGLLARACMTGV